LKDIISKLVLGQPYGILDKFTIELFALLWVGMINAPLEYAAAVFMSSNLDTILSNSVIDELGLERSRKGNTCLSSDSSLLRHF
jgi:hypothetical protein